MLIVQAAASSDPQDTAFVHAVALADKSYARLVSVHAAHGAAPEQPLPPAALWLERWARAPASIEHERIVEAGYDDVTDTLLDVVTRLKPDLLVLSTHARGGLARVLGGSVAEGVARNSTVPVLLLPLRARGLVDPRTGAINLRRALLAAGGKRDTQLAVDGLGLLARIAGASEVALTLLHVDDGTPAPAPQLPRGFSASTQLASGAVEDAIVAHAASSQPCVVVMTSHGHDGLGDVLFASHTERVLHGLGCPLLWVPADFRPAA